MKDRSTSSAAITPRLVLQATVIVAVTSGLLWTARPILDKAHMALAFLLVVLGGSALHGRKLGLPLAVLCFLCFNFFLLPPYYTFVIADPLDWVVLFAFLITGGVAAQLFERARRESRAAHARAEEVARLASLGAETLSAPRAEDAVSIVAQMIHETLRLDRCEIYVRDGDSTTMHVVQPHAASGPPPDASSLALAEIAVENAGIALTRHDGTTRLAARAEDPIEVLLRDGRDSVAVAIPLRVRDRTVGAMCLERSDRLELDESMARFASALATYAALGVERVRLTDEEIRATTLREANRAKDALLASVSHDLRTPLTTIRGIAHEIRTAGDDRAAVIEEEAERLNRIVADLLDLSRIEADAVTLSIDIIAGEDLIGAALQRIGEPSERVDVALPAGAVLPVGRFDFTQSLRALVNLIENALKYSPPGGRVDVRVEPREDGLAIDVMDRGPGIASSDADRIFQPFYRAHLGTIDSPGIGLGLAIARRLAEAQNGAVTFAPRPGGGSVFTLRLPAASAPLENVSS